MIARYEWRFRLPAKLQPVRRHAWTQTLSVTLLAILIFSWLAYHYLLRPSWATSLPPVISELLGLLEWAAVLTVILVGLFIFWRIQRHKRLASRAMTAEALYALSPGAFEQYVANLFRKKGYKVTVRGRSGDHGVDLEIMNGGNRNAIVQCKRYRNPVGPDVVRELFGTMIHERVHHAFLVTTAEISPAARDWAGGKPMTLIDGATLVKIAESLQT